MVPAALVASAPAIADNPANLAEAQALMFPGAQFIPVPLTLSAAQIATLESRSHTTVFRAEVKVWKVSSGGWFFLDQVLGKDDRVTYALALDEAGAVKDVEILTCTEEYCGIRTASWRAQFRGRTASGGDLADDLQIVSGATLSSNHVAEGVKRLLATYALFLAPK